MKAKANSKQENSKVRYAVVGLGHIAQVAVLPAFQHAGENSELTAFVSDDEEKLSELSGLYNVAHTWSYDEYEKCLESGEIDAVYIALPNNMHKDFTVRAAQKGIHVLCEKPMAMNVKECQAMIASAEENHIKLMIAYRLHFEEANMQVVEHIKNGTIGDVRLFTSLFSLQVKEGNIRTQKEKGGGALYDIGIYCINASRYVLRDEPTEVIAFSASSDDERFKEIEEAVGAVMKFPGEKLATFSCSFGAADISRYQVAGTKGNIALDPAFEYAYGLSHKLKVGEETEEKVFPKRDQFAPELIKFSNAILTNKDVSASGQEGLADIRIIEAILKSAQTGRAVKLGEFEAPKRPDISQVVREPGIEKPELVKVSSGSQ